MNFEKCSSAIVERIRDTSIDDETGINTAWLDEKRFSETARLQAFWIRPDTDANLLTNRVAKAGIV